MAEKPSAVDKLQVTIASNRVGFAIAGAGAVVIGILVLIWPATMMKVAALAVAVYALVTGVIYLLIGIRSKKLSSGARTSRFLAAAAFLIAGIIMLTYLGASAEVLTNILGIVLGIFWVGEGLAAATLMRAIKGSGTGLLIYAVAAIAIGVVLLLTPIWGATFLHWFGGFSLVALGLAQLFRAATAARSIELEVETTV